ncbi:MAG: hypothetical protein ACKOXK_11230 [Chakrabartia sp.]
MIGTASVLPYLVAVKSLRHWLGSGRVVLLDDGTLTGADQAVLHHHCNAPPIVSASIGTGQDTPKGGCWERLLTLLDLAQSAYVIQLDSDTLTLGPVPEVRAALEDHRPFTLCGGPDSAFLPVVQAARQARAGMTEATAHIQSRAEAVLDQMACSPKNGGPFYVRGCAAFAGFPPGQISPADACAFSKAAEQLLGQRWHEWGSEQVTSNFLIANAPNPVLLRAPDYDNHWRQDMAAARFAHFPGTHRYAAGQYAALVRRVVAQLAQGD